MDNAAALCDDVLTKEPRHPQALLLRGVIAGQRGKFNAAVETLYRAVESKRKFFQAYNNLGLFLQPLGRQNEAEKCLRKALRIAPQYAEAHNNLGNLLLSQGRADEAVRHYREAMSFQPDNPDAHFNLGLALQAGNDLLGAERALRRATVLRPQWSAPYQALGVVLQSQGRLEDAEAACQKALSIDPRFSQAHNTLGNLRLARGDLEEALACYDRAIELAPDNVEAYLNRGVAHERLDRDDVATQDYRKALSLQPRHVEAMLGIARVYRANGRFSDAETLYREVVEIDDGVVDAYVGICSSRRVTNTDMPLVEHMLELSKRDLASARLAPLHGAIGKAFDDLGDYEAAFDHFSAAKLICHREAPFNREDHAARVRELIAYYQPATIAEMQREASSSELPVLVVGMPRSGTTLVEQILSAHPEIGGVGELPFWAEYEVRFAASQPHGRAAPVADVETGKRYVDLLAAKMPGASRVVDKLTTNYLRIGMICSVLPGVRIIHCRRNPLDTCLSAFFTQFQGRHDYANDLEDLAFYFDEYRKLMAHWGHVLPSEKIFEITYERLVADVEACARALVAFLGLEWSDQCLAYVENKKSVRTASRWQVRQPIYTRSVNRYRNYEAFIGPLLTLEDPNS